MSNRIHALTVLLSDPVSEEEAAALVQAIRMLRGVADVQMHIHDITAAWAAAKARRDLGTQLWNVLYPPPKKD